MPTRERLRGGGVARSRLDAVPDIERRAGELAGRKRRVECTLVEDLGARHVDQESVRLHQLQAALVDQVARRRESDSVTAR